MKKADKIARSNKLDLTNTEQCMKSMKKKWRKAQKPAGVMERLRWQRELCWKIIKRTKWGNIRENLLINGQSNCKFCWYKRNDKEEKVVR